MYCSDLGPDWHAARSEASIVHLDSASAGRSSRAVIDTMTAHLWREAEHGSYIAAAEQAEQLTAGRRALASLVGHPADRLAYRDSARSCLRELLNNWNLPPAATVWVATNEFGPNLAEFERRGIAVRPMPSDDGHVDVDSLENLLRSEQPDFIHVCLVGSGSGLVQPIEPIVRSAHQAGVPVVVDMAQAVGHVPTVTGADVVYGTSRKWLTGPRGIGFIAVRDDALAPVTIENLEPFIAGQLGLGVTVDELLSFGQQEVYLELAKVGQITRERLNGIGSWEVVEPIDEPSAIVTIAPPPGWESSDVAAARERLRQDSILVTAADSWRAPLANERSLIRISPHLDVTCEQLDDLASKLAAMGG